MGTLKELASAVFLTLSLVLLTPLHSFAVTKPGNHKGRSANHSLSRVEVKEAEARLSEMGYGTGRDGVIDRNALVAFQKWEGRKVTGQLSRDEFDAIMSANAPASKDSGYKHVEVDLDRQVLLLI